MTTDPDVLRAALSMAADTLDVIEREADESPGGGVSGTLARNAAREIRALLLGAPMAASFSQQTEVCEGDDASEDHLWDYHGSERDHRECRRCRTEEICDEGSWGPP